MVRFRVLGPLYVEGNAGPIDIGPPKRRTVLAALLLARGRVVSTDRLVDAVWGDKPPDNSSASLQVHVSTLRKALQDKPGSAPAIVRQPPGYYVDVEPGQIDLTLFEGYCQSLRSAVADGRWQESLAAAEEALRLCRGPLLDDLGEVDWIRAEAARVDELHSECRENYVTTLLALNRFREALREVVPLRAAHPYREHGCWLHMVALYRAGRSPEALDAFTSYSTQLAQDLGLDPGQPLRDLQSAILRQSAELARWPESPTAITPVDAVASQPSSATCQNQRRVSLVGRHTEVDAISSVLDDSAAGASRWLLFTGPPGIGKTRLANEAVAMVDSSGGESIWLSCPDERDVPPWWTMRQLVRAIGADVDAIFGSSADHADTARFHLYEKLQALFGATRPQSLMVVIDDIQWADETSVACLAYLAGSVRDAPVAFVVTIRDGEHIASLELLLAAAARVNGNRRIRVPALSIDEVAALANQLADEPLSPSEAEQLMTRTGGNPFFVQEYARLPRREWAEVIPAVRSLLRRRLASLTPTAVETLRIAAAAGATLDATVLARATGNDPATLARHLDDAVHQQILVPTRDATGFAFTHGLIREELLSSLPATRVQQVKAAFGEALTSTEVTVDGQRASSDGC